MTLHAHPSTAPALLMRKGTVVQATAQILGVQGMAILSCAFILKEMKRATAIVLVTVVRHPAPLHGV
jgi:hypothetical protein